MKINLNETTKNKYLRYALAILLCVVIIFFTFNYVKMKTKTTINPNPRQRVVSSFISLASLKENENILLDQYFGLSTMIENSTNNYSLKTNLRFDGYSYFSGKEKTIVSNENSEEPNQPKDNETDMVEKYIPGFSLSYTRFFPDNRIKGNIGILDNGEKILNSKIDLYGNNITLDLSSINTPVSLDTSKLNAAEAKHNTNLSNISQDVKDKFSFYFERIKTFIRPDYSLFNFIKNDNSLFLKEFKSFGEKWEVEKTDSATFQLDGKPRNFDGFIVKIKKADTVNFLKNLQLLTLNNNEIRKNILYFIAEKIRFMDNRVLSTEDSLKIIDEKIKNLIGEVESSFGIGDIEMTVYLTSDNKIVALKANSLWNKEERVLKLTREGGGYLNENASLLITDLNGDKRYLDLSSIGALVEGVQNRTLKLSYKVDENTDSSLRLDKVLNTNNGSAGFILRYSPDSSEKNLQINFSGTFADLRKGTNLKINMDPLSIFKNGKNLLYITGDFAFSSDDLSYPDIRKERKDFLSLSKEESDSLINLLRNSIKIVKDIFMK